MLRRKKGGGWYFGEPKTAKSRRTVPMSPEIFAKLKNWRSEQRTSMMKLGSEYERNDLVFATEFGKPLDLKNIRSRNYVRILKSAGLGHYEIVGDKKVFIPAFVFTIYGTAWQLSCSLMAKTRRLLVNA